jgi:anti-sigma regulatory factor (Ser/Thr protein kinase)
MRGRARIWTRAVASSSEVRLWTDLGKQSGLAMSGSVLLRVPAALEYRELTCRTVSAVCKLSQRGTGKGGAARRFSNELMSAVGEAFNNVVLHAYAHTTQGTVEIDLDWTSDRVVVEVRDRGTSFDLDAVPVPDLGLPQEQGMGVFIIRAFVDEVEYRPGSPNVLVLTKRVPRVDSEPRSGRTRSGQRRSPIA